MLKLVSLYNRIVNALFKFLYPMCYKCKHFKTTTIRCFYCEHESAFEPIEEKDKQ